MDNYKALGQVILFWHFRIGVPKLPGHLAQPWTPSSPGAAPCTSRLCAPADGQLRATAQRWRVGRRVPWKKLVFHGYDRIYPDINGFSMRFNHEN